MSLPAFWTPLFGSYNMLPVILYKDLHATPLQIASIIALKPLVSLLSMYWSSAINSRSDRLRSNIISARLIGYLPFFFFPFVDNVWFFIGAFGLYMMLAIGTAPAWMEILKLNIPKESRERVFSYSQAFGYMGGGLLPFALGWVLDAYFQAWRWLFPIASCIGLLAFIFERRILIPFLQGESVPLIKSTSITDDLLKPWNTGMSGLMQEQVGV